MVLPLVAAANAAGAAGTAGATALGLGMGKTDMDLSRELFKDQMRQSKRLWTADWAEASVRHGETTMQAAQHHSEGQAMSVAAYYQAEKLASQSIKLARDQDSRAYEMAWRAEVRESLRDELGNQNNRFNIIMLCDTVCLGCVFTLVAEIMPDETPKEFLYAYVFCLGISIMLFSISLWGSIIVVRRIHDNTASRLERKLFAQSEDLQEAWQQQLDNNIPTGHQEIYLVHQAYERWVIEYLDPIGKMSVEMLSVGVVTMFLSAGIFIHNMYLIQYDDEFISGRIFYSTVFVTCTAMLYMKLSEDRKEKKKEGVYDVSWQDRSTVTTGPFAKIDKAAEELSSSAATELGSLERAESFGVRERIERGFCPNTQTLHNRMDSLRRESNSRTKTRKDIMQLLTTAVEERDALPEELTSHTNKILHSIDEADMRTAALVTTQTDNENKLQEQEAFPVSPYQSPQTRRGHFSSTMSQSLIGTHRIDEEKMPASELMGTHPIDAQRIPVSLGSLRKKLGEISHTTLLRLRNTSNEPIRLKSGVQLKQGKYVVSIHASDPDRNAACFHLYPGTEIPPHTEVLVASRSGGGWFPTSGIVGELVYTNHDESWTFEISFRNDLIGNVRRCHVKAYPTSGTDDDSTKSSKVHKEYSQIQKYEHDGKVNNQYWQISKYEYDGKANNEIVVSFKVTHGEEAKKASFFSYCRRQPISTTKIEDSIECVHQENKTPILLHSRSA